MQLFLRLESTDNSQSRRISCVLFLLYGDEPSISMDCLLICRLNSPSFCSPASFSSSSCTASSFAAGLCLSGSLAGPGWIGGATSWAKRGNTRIYLLSGVADCLWSCVTGLAKNSKAFCYLNKGCSATSLLDVISLLLI